MQLQQADPLWDEGIAGYLSAEYAKKDAPLTAEDLQKFANQEAIRVGDLLETLFLMAIYGSWHYCDEKGEARELDEEALDTMYAMGRISAEQMKEFDGVWLPAI